MKGDGNVTLELFVRSLAPARGTDRQREIIDTLDDLESEGQIDGYNVHVWGDAVATDTVLAETGAGRAVHNQIAAFKQWALAENVSVEPFFEKKTTRSTLTDDEQTVIVLPEIALAEYEDDELVTMAPHRAADETTSVSTLLEEIELRRERTLSEQAAAASRLAVPSGD